MSDSDEILQSLPDWSELEEDTWMERFGSISDLLMGSRLDPDAPDGMTRLGYQERLDLFRADVLMAADLADLSVEEVRRRTEVQKSKAAARRNKTKAEYESRRRKGRTEARRK